MCITAEWSWTINTLINQFKKKKIRVKCVHIFVDISSVKNVFRVKRSSKQNNNVEYRHDIVRSAYGWYALNGHTIFPRVFTACAATHVKRARRTLKSPSVFFSRVSRSDTWRSREKIRSAGRCAGRLRRKTFDVGKKHTREKRHGHTLSRSVRSFWQKKTPPTGRSPNSTKLRTPRDD